MGKDLEGSGLALIVVISWHLPGGTKEDYVNLMRAAPSRTRSEINNSFVQDVSPLSGGPICWFVSVCSGYIIV
jgi:hypothetical protein